MGIFLFFFNDTATTYIYTLSLHDALPISLNLELKINLAIATLNCQKKGDEKIALSILRSEEHTSELQSHHDLVCRLLLEERQSAVRAQNRSNQEITRGDKSYQSQSEKRR